MYNSFENFLDTFIGFLCNRCITGYQHHNGEILEYLINQENIDIFNGIMTAYYADISPKSYANCLINPNPKKDLLYKTLIYFYKNKDQVFIRHGLEKIKKSDYNIHSIFPPKNSYHDINKEMNLIDHYAIELDKVPFNYCSNHGHAYGSPWYYIAGYIALKDFVGTTKLSQDRDHFYATSNLKANNWVFVLNDFDSNIDLNSDISRTDLVRNVEQIQNSGLRYINKNVLQKFFHLVLLIENVVEAGKLCSIVNQ